MTILDPTERDARWQWLDERIALHAARATVELRLDAIHHRRAIGQHARQALARWMRETGRA